MIAENPRVSALRKSTLSESAPKEEKRRLFLMGSEKVTKRIFFSWKKLLRKDNEFHFEILLLKTVPETDTGGYVEKTKAFREPC